MKDMLNIIHKNHERANAQYNEQRRKQEERKRYIAEKKHKEELSKHRAITMLVVSFVLLTFMIWGII